MELMPSRKWVSIAKILDRSVVWDGLSQQLSEKLQKLQNRAARVITKSSYNTNSNYLLNSLSWDNLSVRRTKQKANLMYKCVNKLAPNYLCNMSTPRTLSFDLRDARQKLYLPKPRTDASVIAEILFGTIFLRISALQNLYATSREELINGSLYRTPTRQIRKPGNKKFYLRWISSLFSIVMLIFLPCFK